MNNPEVIINGTQGDQLSTLDRGLLYGDGVFETIAVKQGKAQFWTEHLERLLQGCSVLNLEGLEVSLLEKELQLILHSEANSNCVIKIIITRGIGGRGYRPTQQPLTRIVQKFPWPDYPASFVESGVKVTQCDFRLSKQSRLSKIKHLNRLEQVLARSEWEDDYQEGLVCDDEGNVIEGTSNNVFFQLNDHLVTPRLNQCGVEGVMRKKIIEYCHQNSIALEIRAFEHAEMDDIKAMFLCNSINAIWPVKRYCERTLGKTDIIDQLIAAFNR
ncbi:MAG: aminodeoxychorismate lyase [Gammaproteobacteria bacterium]